MPVMRGIRFAFARRRLVNFLQAATLLAALYGLLLLIVWLFAGPLGLVLIAITGLPLLLFGSALGPALVLRMYRAVPLARSEAPELLQLADALARRAGLPGTPLICYIPTPALLAFSVGLRPHGAIALSDGLLRLLPRDELSGVIAHEIGHIVGHDTRVMGLADLANRLVSAIAGAGQFLILLNLPLYLLTDHPLPWGPLLLMILAPFLTTLLQLGLSRSREFEADLTAVRLTGDPRGLANALARMESIEALKLRRLFGLGRGLEVPSVLRTHPATPRRIARLQELAAEAETEQGPFRTTGEDFRALPPGMPQPRDRPRRRSGGLWY